MPGHIPPRISSDNIALWGQRIAGIALNLADQHLAAETPPCEGYSADDVAGLAAEIMRIALTSLSSEPSNSSGANGRPATDWCPLTGKSVEELLYLVTLIKIGSAAEARSKLSRGEEAGKRKSWTKAAEDVIRPLVEANFTLEDKERSEDALRKYATQLCQVRKDKAKSGARQHERAYDDLSIIYQSPDEDEDPSWRARVRALRVKRQKPA